MASWTHTYREQAIPGPNPSGVITAHRPGQKLAKAVTEIQERAVVDLNLDLEGITNNGSNIENNTLNLRLAIEPTEPSEGTTQTIFAVAGGEWPTLNVQSLEVENGLIKNVSDGQGLYPDKDLFTGPMLSSANLSLSAGRVLSLGYETRRSEQGVITKEKIGGKSQVNLNFADRPGRDAIAHSQDVVTGISFTGTQLVAQKTRLVFDKGILVDTIDLEEDVIVTFESYACP